MKEKLRGAKELYDQYKIFIYPVLVGLASLFLILFLILPQIRGFFSGRENLQQVKENLKILTAKAEDLAAINEDTLKQKLGVALTALPLEKDFAQVLGVLQDVAQVSGVSLTSIQVGQAQASSESGFAVKVEVVGSKFTLATFLRDVENASRVMKVQGVELAFSRTREGADASILVDVFYAPTPQALGAVTESLPQITTEDEAIISSLSRAPVSTFSATSSLPRGKANPFD